MGQSFEVPIAYVILGSLFKKIKKYFNFANITKIYADENMWLIFLQSLRKVIHKRVLRFKLH